MRVPRVFCDVPLAVGEPVSLNEAQSHYLSKVLRLEAGRPLKLFNGDGREYQATVVQVGKRSVEVQIGDAEHIVKESPLHTHLAVGISRGERMDLVLQKATELGVSRITPLFTERTEVRLQGERLQKKMEHWRQITISACEQCQRNVLPELAEAQDLEVFLREPNRDLKLVLHHRSETTLKQYAPQTGVTLLIGPEGGLSDSEIQLAIEHFQYAPLTLGPRVLRTETAPLAALTAVQLLWGDLS